MDKATPRSLEQALKLGWVIDEELCSWSFGAANKREGFLILRHAKASRTLMLRCIALYELSAPYFVEEE